MNGQDNYPYGENVKFQGDYWQSDWNKRVAKMPSLMSQMKDGDVVRLSATFHPGNDPGLNHGALEKTPNGFVFHEGKVPLTDCRKYIESFGIQIKNGAHVEKGKIYYP